MNLHKWLLGDREPIVQRPVIVHDVEPARPNEEIAAEVRETQTNYIQTMLRLARRSAALKSSLARSALLQVKGTPSAKNHF